MHWEIIESVLKEKDQDKYCEFLQIKSGDPFLIWKKHKDSEGKEWMGRESEKEWVSISPQQFKKPIDRLTLIESLIKQQKISKKFLNNPKRFFFLIWVPLFDTLATPSSFHSLPSTRSQWIAKQAWPCLRTNHLIISILY